jgi:large subunit ribosomal protein L21
MHAVFRTGGKQFRVEPGTRVKVPTLQAEPGESVTFEDVLLTSDGEAVTVGAPLVEGASVTAEVLAHGKAKKIIVFHRKRRKNSRKKQGHRQKFTEIVVNEIRL